MTKTAFLFSGQGAQYVGMAKDICEAHPEAADVFARADEILGRSISTVAFEGPEEALGQTENTQPAVLTCEIALLRVLEAKGMRAQVCAGFSLGEWAALVCAGVLNFETALPLIQKRARLMQQAVPIGEGGMAVILGKTAEETEALCAGIGDVYPSNYNCPGQITVAGRSDGIDALLAYAEQNGVIAKRLAISVPSHCPLMKSAAEALAAVIEDLPFANANMPVFMNCSGEAETEGARIKKNIIEQLTHPVLFQKSIEAILGLGISEFIEIGPGKTLCGLVRKTAKPLGIKAAALSSDSVASIAALEDSLHG